MQGKGLGFFFFFLLTIYAIFFMQFLALPSHIPLHMYINQQMLQHCTSLPLGNKLNKSFPHVYRQHRELRPRLWLPTSGLVSWWKPASCISWRLSEPPAGVSQWIFFPRPWTASHTSSLQCASTTTSPRVLVPTAQPNQPLTVLTHQCAPRPPPEKAAQHSDTIL